MLYLMLVVVFSKLTEKWWLFLLGGWGKINYLYTYQNGCTIYHSTNTQILVCYSNFERVCAINPQEAGNCVNLSIFLRASTGLRDIYIHLRASGTVTRTINGDVR